MNKKVIFGIIGFFLGFPISYYFQPEKLRAMLSMTDYLQSIPKLASSDKGDFLTPIIFSCLISTAIFVFIGYLLDQNNKNVIVAKPQKRYCGNCGHQIDEDYPGEFCDQCGHKLD